mgnify:CR=1 FL=1
MSTLLLMTNALQPSMEVLPGLALLGHQVKILPADVSWDEGAATLENAVVQVDPPHVDLPLAEEALRSGEPALILLPDYSFQTLHDWVATPWRAALLAAATTDDSSVAIGTSRSRPSTRKFVAMPTGMASVVTKFSIM